MERDTNILSLPLAIVGRVEASRLARELGALDEFLAQAAIRQPGTKALELPRTSKLLEETARQNTLNLLDVAQRQQLLHFLQEVIDNAPVLHMSFGADPSPGFLNKLMKWLREEIHPLVLVQIGLQPTVAVGCTLRTTNKYFDFSLRQHFLESREDLITRIGSSQEPLVADSAPTAPSSLPNATNSPPTESPAGSTPSAAGDAS